VASSFSFFRDLGHRGLWACVCVTQPSEMPDVGEQAHFDCMIDEEAIQFSWDTVGCKLDERGQRMFAAGEVQTAG
jgi:hypothetical protein